LRARYNLRTPDALQVATALVRRCEAFLTNDARLKRVTEIRVLTLDDRFPPPAGGTTDVCHFNIPTPTPP
jgi:predicted nucleic acid-binding protein